MDRVRYVAYMRRSTTDQEQSLARQRSEIERYAKEHGIEVEAWFSDDGISGVEDETRPDFQRMIAAAERRQFDVIVVYELSRFGRFETFQSAGWMLRLKRARVRIEAIAGRVKDPYSLEGRIIAALEQDREEVFKLSFRTLSGQREVAEKGLRAGGRCPFGYTRIRHRADGKVEDAGRAGTAKRDKREKIELAPGDPIEVECVQEIFRMAHEGVGYRSIAQRMADRGIPSPDAIRGRKVASIPGAWTATTVRAILLNRAYVGDAIWNRTSRPKFHRLEGGKVVPIEDHEQDQHKRNERKDWIVVPDAHPKLIDREVFDAVQLKIRSQRSTARGHVNEYLLTGLIRCESCGDAYIGTTVTRLLMREGEERRVSEPQYFCGGTLRAKDRCRRVGIPRDLLEAAILRILDEVVFRPEALAKLEERLRRQLARRRATPIEDGIAPVERRERDLQRQIADGARRMLLVDPSLIPDLNAALAELKDELTRVQRDLESRRRAASATEDGERTIRETLDRFRSMASVLRNPSLPLEQRKDVLRRLLPIRDGVRPIRVHIDLGAPPGWRKALKRVQVRHVSFADRPPAGDASGFVVSPAGVEPAACALGKHRSIQLSYGDEVEAALYDGGRRRRIAPRRERRPLLSTARRPGSFDIRSPPRARSLSPRAGQEV